MACNTGLEVKEEKFSRWETTADPSPHISIPRKEGWAKMSLQPFNATPPQCPLSPWVKGDKG
jgi:hypothetical protein